MATRMQQRRGTAAQWISTNEGNGPILAAGEIGFESDTNKFKIGDGVNHWVDLTYFTDATAALAAVSDIIDGAPDVLNTLNELANSLGDDPDFIGTITTDLAAKQDKVTGVSDTEIGYLSTVTSSVQGQLDSKASTGALSDHSAATTSVHGIADTSLLATQDYVDTAVGNSTVDQSALAGIGIDWNLVSEQFDIDETVATTDYVDTAIGNIDALPAQATNDGRFLQTDGTTASWQVVDLSTKQDVVSGVSSTEIGYLDGVTSAIQTQLNGKAESTDLNGLATETYVDTAIGNIDALPSQATNDGRFLQTDGTTASWQVVDLTDYVTFDGTETLANKTLESPTVTASTTVSTDEYTRIEGLTNGFGNAFNGSVLNINWSEIFYTPNEKYGTSATIQNKTATASFPDAENVEFTLNEIVYNAIDNYAYGYMTLLNPNQTKIDAISAWVALEYSNLTVNFATGDQVQTTDTVTVSSTELSYLDGVTSAIQTQLNAKAPLASPTFTGNAEVANLVVSGNLTVSGTTTTIDTTNLNITDSMIYMGEDNPANLLDLGIVSSFNDGTYQHTGLVRDASAGTWKLFKGVTDEPTTTVNFGQGSLDDIAVGALAASSATIGDVSNTELQYVHGVTSGIQTQLDAKSTASKTETLTNKTIALGSGNSITTNGFDIEEAIFFYSMIN